MKTVIYILALAATVAVLTLALSRCGDGPEIYINGIRMDEAPMAHDIADWYEDIVAAKDSAEMGTAGGTKVIVRVNGKNVTLWGSGSARLPGVGGFIRLKGAKRETADWIIQFYEGRKSR